MSRERETRFGISQDWALEIRCKVKIYLVSLPFLMSWPNIGSTSALRWYEPISSPEWVRTVLNSLVMK